MEHQTTNLGVRSSNLFGRANKINNLMEIGQAQEERRGKRWGKHPEAPAPILRSRRELPIEPGDVYDRHGYAEEDKRIMSAVARHILGVVNGTGTGNVIQPEVRYSRKGEDRPVPRRGRAALLLIDEQIRRSLLEGDADTVVQGLMSVSEPKADIANLMV